MHISYININYKRFAGYCFEMNSSAVQLNLRFLRHSAWGERIYLRFIPGKRHFCVDCLARFAVSKAVFSVWIYGSNHIGGIDCANGYIYAPVEARLTESICIISSCSMTAKRSNIPGYIMICRASI